MVSRIGARLEDGQTAVFHLQQPTELELATDEVKQALAVEPGPAPEHFLALVANP